MSNNTVEGEFEPEPTPKLGKRTVLTNHDEIEVAERYRSGELVLDLADAFCVHRATIANCLDRQGVRGRGLGPRRTR